MTQLSLECPRIHVEISDGLRVLRVSGALDLTVAEEFGKRADRAIQAVPGPVVLDLSGLTFIDARGARTLAAVTHALPGGRRVAVRGCVPEVRFVFDLLGLPMNFLPADYLAAWEWAGPPSRTRELVLQVREARIQASAARLYAGSVLARVTDTSIRLASLRERTDLAREQGRQTLASTRLARERVISSRQEACDRPG